MKGEDAGARVGKVAVGSVRGARLPRGQQVPHVLPQVHLDRGWAPERGGDQPLHQREPSRL
jgi:hypothetical protein